jgi:hypothetical protein
MSIDSTSFKYLFNAINQFIFPRVPLYRGLVEVNQELEKISPLFNARTLSLEIFSLFPILPEGLNNFFSVHQGLRQFYSSKISDFPANSTVLPSHNSATLILKSNSELGQSEAKYELSLTQNILMGRDLQYQNDDKFFHIPLPIYKKVSGHHAEIQPVSSASSTSQSWQICDLNSTNGTYINNQKIEGCQVLKSGDKITLAYPSASKKSPVFIFEEQASSPTFSNSDLTLVDSDLVCLVIHPTQGLSTPEKQLVEQISRSLIFGFIIIADVSDTNPEVISSIRENIVSIQGWIKAKYPELAKISEVTELPLSPFYPNTLPGKLIPAVEQQLVQFATPLIDLAKTQGSELLTSRIRQKLQTQIQQIDQILDFYEEGLKHEIQRTEASLNGNSLEYWRDYYGQLKRLIDEARDDFFREARNQFLRAREEFSTDFIPDNLFQCTDAFVNRLEAAVTRLNGQVCIQLQPNNGQDIHSAIMSFCQAKLTQWGNQRWKEICHTISGHGLEGFIKQSYNQLNFFPEFQLTNTFSSPSSQLDFTRHFNTSFSEVKADISYSESSGDAFGGIAKIAMLTASAAIGATMGSPYAVIQGASAVSAIGSFLGGSLSRPQQESLKLAQVVDSLRRNTCNHYRNIARYLLNRVAQEIGSAIDAEDRRFRKARDTSDEQIRKYFMELENISRGYRIRQETLYKDRIDFEKIKRLGG